MDKISSKRMEELQIRLLMSIMGDETPKLFTTKEIHGKFRSRKLTMVTTKVARGDSMRRKTAHSLRCARK